MFSSSTCRHRVGLDSEETVHILVINGQFWGECKSWSCQTSRTKICQSCLSREDQIPSMLSGFNACLQQCFWVFHKPGCWLTSVPNHCCCIVASNFERCLLPSKTILVLLSQCSSSRSGAYLSSCVVFLFGLMKKPGGMGRVIPPVCTIHQVELSYELKTNIVAHLLFAKRWPLAGKL